MVVHTESRADTGAVVPPDIYDPNVNALRFLAVDAVNRANSGHPGTPLDVAPVIYRLFTRHLRHDPSDPQWPDRDRFVLSGGHASMVLYGALYLCGYDITLDDIRSFRQLGSKCAGHPERGLAPGIEVTTGPLGQGIANAVGLALAERLLAARFNRPGHEVVNHYTYVECGDGDLMEGVCAEACSLAGHLGLGKLVVFYDDNEVTLDGPASWSTSEDITTRFLAQGWHVIRLGDVDNFAAIDAAVAAAQQRAHQPSIIVMHSHIGIGTPLHDSHKAHGSPIGEHYAQIARQLLRWPHAEFVVPDEVYQHWHDAVAGRAAARADWCQRFTAYRSAYPELAEELTRVIDGRLPPQWHTRLPSFPADGDPMATRSALGHVLNALAEVLPELVGGAADVESSTKTRLTGYEDVRRGSFTGRNLHFGIREHGMAAIVNGLAAHGGLRPFGATFFCFSDYLRGGLRLCAIMGLPALWVFTHDSIGLGEDGTTHQPVEQLAGLRAMPNLLVIRPADANETAQAFAVAVERGRPTALVLSRQDLPVLDPTKVDVRGAVLANGDDAAIVATGSEVTIALAARELLLEDGVQARVVSLPSFELFRERADDERRRILPPDLPTVAVEAASPFGWSEFADHVIGMTTFGASAKAADLFPHFGITPDAVAQAVRTVRAEPAPGMREAEHGR
ncbi:MAG: transketolase [Pseudonocardiaceae bacterium]